MKVLQNAIILIRAVLIILILPIYGISFAQETDVSTLSREAILKGMEREKGRALKSGNKEKAASFDAMIQDLKAGRVTAEEIMGEEQRGPTPKAILKGMEREKGRALKSGNKEKAASLDAMIQDLKAGRITVEEIMGEVQGGSTPEAILKDMEREKGRALKSGNKEKAASLDAMIQDLKAGRVTAEEIMDQEQRGPTPEAILKGMEIEKGRALKSGNKEKAASLDAMIQDLKAGRVTAEEIFKGYKQD